MVRVVALVGRALPDRLLAEQVGEECPVVDDRLPELLGAGLASGVAQVDLVRVPVVAQRAGVLDGEVGDLVGEVAGRVALLLDEPGDQFVCVADGLAG